MRHVLVHLTPDMGYPARYETGAFMPAVGHMLQLACALAVAGAGVTVRIAPDFLDSPQAKAAMAQPGAALLAVEQAVDSEGLHAMLHRLRPHACLIWDGGWEPDVAATCHMAGIQTVFAGTGWFDRERSLILDPISVAHSSALGGGSPPEGVPLSTRRARLGLAGGKPARRLAGDCLLVLLDSGQGSYHTPAYADTPTLVAALRQRFAGRMVALRAHPTETWRVPPVLPPGLVNANAGTVQDWAAHCTAAIGASSKAVFAATLYERPVVLIGSSMADGATRTTVFPHRDRFADITDVDLAGDAQAGPASAFLYEALFRRHVFLDDCSPWALRRNRVLEPLLAV